MGFLIKLLMLLIAEGNSGSKPGTGFGVRRALREFGMRRALRGFGMRRACVSLLQRGVVMTCRRTALQR